MIFDRPGVLDPLDRGVIVEACPLALLKECDLDDLGASVVEPGRVRRF